MKVDWRIKALMGCGLVAALGSGVLASGALDRFEFSAFGAPAEPSRDVRRDEYTAVPQSPPAGERSSWEAALLDAYRR